jgi:lysophospholipase L1-like esterase
MMRISPALLLVTLGASILAGGTLVSPANAAVAPAAATPLKIMPLGASMTYGYNSTDGNGYREVLRKHLVNEAGLSIDYVGSMKSGNMADPDNEGHSGYRIDQVANGVDSWLATYKPSLVLLNVGTNDTIQNYQLSTAPDRLSALIDRILADDPGVTVMASTVMPTPDTARNDLVKALNAKLPAIVNAKAAAGKPVHLVDIYSALSLADIGSDQIHPTDAGYAKIADRWYADLKPVLGIADSVSGIVKGQASGRCADVPGYSQTNGTGVALWDCNGGTNQSWTATPSKQLMVYGAKCLDVNGASVANGAKVQIWDCNGGTNQQWTVNSDGTIVGVASGRCLDAIGQGTANGTLLEIWDCNGGGNQKWSRS